MTQIKSTRAVRVVGSRGSGFVLHGGIEGHSAAPLECLSRPSRRVKAKRRGVRRVPRPKLWYNPLILKLDPHL